MNIVLATPALVVGDGVSNDVLGMARALRRREYNVVCATYWKSAHYDVVSLRKGASLLRSPEDVLLYHHSIDCEQAIRMVETLPCRKAVKYHNITPPQFFASLHPKIAEGCAEGLRQVQRLVDLDLPFWVDSPFNGRELAAAYPNQRFEVLPPFNQVEELFQVEPDLTTVGLHDDWLTNILVVGRLAPNKNVIRAVEAFAVYRERHDPRSRLILVGDLGQKNQNAYCDVLVRRIGELGLAAHVYITGKISLQQLKAFYLTAQMLLTTSSHEGFCLPLIEAMAFRVPIVALANTAIPDTGGDVALYTADNPEQLAAAMASIRTDPADLEDRLDRGWHRYEGQFDNRAVESQFLRLFDEIVTGKETRVETIATGQV